MLCARDQPERQRPPHVRREKGKQTSVSAVLCSPSNLSEQQEVPAIRRAWAVSGMRVLEWVAVEHHSTERPQDHVVVCGFGASGGSFW